MATRLLAAVRHFTFALVGIMMLFVEASGSIGGIVAAVSRNINAEGSTFHGETIRSQQRTLSPVSTTFCIDGSALSLHLNPFEEMLAALDTMQSHFFEVWLGQWPDAIDWTAAVTNSYLSTTMASILRAKETLGLDPVNSTSDSMHFDKFPLENMINKYFSQSISYYFAEDAFDIRNEAYDDMLWVVLGWLESIKLMELHAKSTTGSNSSSSWYGQQFAPAFAHRAHIFYHIAQAGWDETLCGGGLTWNPSLQPYKNTITNTLFISASVEMYLYHPGDDNSSPFSRDPRYTNLPLARPHDQRWLNAAIAGYQWLSAVNMTNSLGLYVDGYHIREWWHGNTECNQRDDSVYTYNQGVVLSGLRGLWESTGNVTYLEDAHKLVRNVIIATGWSLDNQVELDTHWHGLGRHGVLTETCDPRGDCSQDGQSFKGIFFKHVTDLCYALPSKEAEATIPGKTYVADEDLARMHERSCTSYVKWVARNAMAAMATRDEDGLFGMWWVASESHSRSESQPESSTRSPQSPPTSLGRLDKYGYGSPGNTQQTSLRVTHDPIAQRARDPNDRGRGRTVETQGGGLMVVRALHEFLQRYGDQT